MPYFQHHNFGNIVQKWTIYKAGERFRERKREYIRNSIFFIRNACIFNVRNGYVHHGIRSMVMGDLFNIDDFLSALGTY